MKFKKKLYIKAIGLESQKQPYQEYTEKVLKVTQKALHIAIWKFLKLFEDTASSHHKKRV